MCADEQGFSTCFNNINGTLFCHSLCSFCVEIFYWRLARPLPVYLRGTRRTSIRGELLAHSMIGVLMCDHAVYITIWVRELTLRLLLVLIHVLETLFLFLPGCKDVVVANHARAFQGLSTMHLSHQHNSKLPSCSRIRWTRQD